MRHPGIALLVVISELFEELLRSCPLSGSGSIECDDGCRRQYLKLCMEIRPLSNIRSSRENPLGMLPEFLAIFKVLKRDHPQDAK